MTKNLINSFDRLRVNHEWSRRIKKAGRWSALALGTLVPLLAFAQRSTLPQINVTGPADVIRIINNVLNWSASVLFVIGAIALIYAAIRFLTSGGSEAAVASAKSALLYAIIGIAVGVIALAIEPFIEGVFR